MTKLPLPNAEPVDALLSRYFQAELPAAWPRCPVVVPRRFRGSVWSQRLPRLALAASVALLFAGYLSLARWVPREATGGGLPTDGQTTIGLRQRPGTPKAAPADEERPTPLIPDAKLPRR